MDADHSSVFVISLIELLFMMDGVVTFPVASPKDGTWTLPSEVPFVPAQPTAAAKLRLLVGAFRGAFRDLQLMSSWRVGIDITHLGVVFPCEGIVMGCNPVLMEEARK